MPTPDQLMAQATAMANQGGPGKNAAAADAWLQQQMQASGYQLKEGPSLLDAFDATPAGASTAAQPAANDLLSEFDATPTQAPKASPAPASVTESGANAGRGMYALQRAADALSSPMPLLRSFGPVGAQYIERKLYNSDIPGAKTLAGVIRGEADIPASAAKVAAMGAQKLGIAPALAGDIHAAISQDNADYEALRKAAAPASDEPGFDWARLGGQALALGPLREAKLLGSTAGGLLDTAAGRLGLSGLEQGARKLGSTALGRAANRAAQGGVAAGLSSDQSEGSLGSQMGIGAGLGVALPPVLNAVAERTLVPAASGLVRLAKAGKQFLTEGSEAAESKAAAAGVPPHLDQAINGKTPESQAEGARKTIEENIASIEASLEIKNGGIQLDRSKLDDQVKQLLDKSYLKDLTPEQQNRMLAYEALGVKDYTLSDVTRDYADAAATRNLAQNIKSGGPIREADLLKNQQLLGAAQRAEGMTKGEVGDAYSAGEQVQKALQGQVDTINTRIGELYKQADEAAKGAAKVGTNPISQSLTGLRSQFLATSEGKGLLNGIRARLQDFSGGPPKEPGRVLLLDANGKPLLTEGDIPKKMTFQDSERFRQYLNDIWTPDNARLVSKIKKAVDQAQDAAGGGKIYAEARALRAQRADLFENKDGISKILSGKMPVDRFMDLYVTNKGNADALQQVVTQLKAGGNHQQLNNLKATVVRQMIDKATHAGGPNSTGAQNFSGLTFRNELDKIGARKLGILFSPEEQNYLGMLSRGAVDLTTDPVVRNTFNPSGTAAQAGNLLDAVFGTGPKEPEGMTKLALKAVLHKIPGANILGEVAQQAKDRMADNLAAQKAAGVVNPNTVFAASQAAKAKAAQQAQRDAIARLLRLQATTAGALPKPEN